LLNGIELSPLAPEILLIISYQDV